MVWARSAGWPAEKGGVGNEGGGVGNEGGGMAGGERRNDGGGEMEYGVAR
jgi:hypothetical protein